MSSHRCRYQPVSPPELLAKLCLVFLSPFGAIFRCGDPCAIRSPARKRCRQDLTGICFLGLIYHSRQDTAAHNFMKLRSIVVPLVITGLWSLFPSAARALSVCADPDYLPYSNRAGEGFENKIAVAVAKALGEKVEYTWASSRGHG